MSFFSKEYNGYKLPQVDILINGSEIDSKQIKISDIEVDLIRNGSGSFRFTVSEAIDYSFNPKFEKLLHFGNHIEIKLGYGEKKKTAIVGFISSLSYNFTEKNFLDIEVEGYDYLFLLTKNKIFRSWNEQKISDIVKLILQRYPISKKDIESTDITYKYLQQNGISDLQFLKDLSFKTGYEFLFIDDTFFFRKPILNRSPDFSLEFGIDILSFRPVLDVTGVIPDLSVYGWDFTGKKAVKSTILQGEERELNQVGTSGTNIVKEELKTTFENQINYNVQSIEEAEKIGKSLFENTSLEFVSARCTLPCIPDIKPSSIISIENIGDKFSKRYFVERVIHTFSDEGFETVLELRGNKI